VDSTRRKGSGTLNDPRIAAIPDVHGHAKGEHRPYAEERPIAYSARMLFLWFYHACRRNSPQFLMVADHANYLTFEDPGAVNTVRRALKLAHAGDLYGAAETAGVDVIHASVVSEGLRRGMRFSIGAEIDNDPRSRPDAQNIIDAMRPDGIIRSVHFVNIEHPEKGADWPWPFDNEEFVSFYETVGTERLWELYLAKLLEDVEKLPTNIVGHFYVPASFGHWPARKKLEEYEDRLLNVCHGRGLAVEINTRFLYRERPEELKEQYLEANARLIHKAKQRGVGIAIGSDAHSPKDQGNAFDSILKLLDDARINELVFPVDGRLARVALRATREHLEAEERKRETALPGSSITGYGRAELGLPEEAAQPAATRRAAAKAGREASPRKRAVPPTKPSTSRRSAESTASSSRAKAARSPKAASTSKSKAAAPKKAAPKKTAPKKTAPKKTAPKKAAPKKAAPMKAAPKKAAPKKVAPQRSTAAKHPVLARAKAAKPAAKRPKPSAKRATKPKSKTIARTPPRAAKRPAAKKKKTAARKRR
jgi:HisJ family histidinol phosphate phosphatase